MYETKILAFARTTAGSKLVFSVMHQSGVVCHQWLWPNSHMIKSKLWRVPFFPIFWQGDPGIKPFLNLLILKIFFILRLSFLVTLFSFLRLPFFLTSFIVTRLSQTILDYLGQSRTILDNIWLSQNILNYLGLSWTISDYLGLPQKI